MLSLFQVKSNSIFFIQKSKETKDQKQMISLLIDVEEFSKRNKNIYMDKYFNIKDDDIRREFKKYKIKIEDQIIVETNNTIDNLTYEINKYKTEYSFENSIKRNIYKFEINL